MPKKKKQENQGLESTIKAIKSKFGAGSIFTLGDNQDQLTVDAIPSGSRKLDKILGVGGWPRGRIVELYGPESSGKSTICLHAIAEAQKQGLTAAYIDAEHALDPRYCEAIGVKLDELVVSQPSSGEEALEILDKLVRSGDMAIIIVDSVAALTPQAEIEGEMSDQQMGLQARLMSKAMRKITHSASANNCLVMFINQTREKIGVMFGNPTTTPGGNALKFYASIRVELRRGKTLTVSDNVVGNLINTKVAKNKVAAPFRSAELSVLHGKGLSRGRELLDELLEAEIIKQSGAWFSIGEENIAQGRPAAIDYVDKHYDELLNLLEGEQ